MNPKDIVYNKEARQKLQAGVDKLANAVVTTLGPKGRNVALDKKAGTPRVVHDGVSISKDIYFKDPFENIGAQLVKEAAGRTNEGAGDGTTTATILAQAMVREGMKAIEPEKFLFWEFKGANPMVMRRGMVLAQDAVLKELKELARPIKTKAELTQVASISTADEKLGRIVANAMEAVGENGILDVEIGSGNEIEVEITEGMQFDRGFVSPHFQTNLEKGLVEVRNPYIFITDKTLASVFDIQPLLEVLVNKNGKKDLFIMAEDISGEALATLAINAVKGNLNVNAVRIPEFGDRRKDVLSDIAAVTGATIISQETGRDLKTINFEDFGRARKVKSTKESTQIIGGLGSKEEVAKRVKAIEHELSKTKSEFDKEKLRGRLARLSTGVGVIMVGAATETEVNDTKERIIDAVGATKSAREEGIVAGGGVALIHARQVIKGLDLTGDEEIGAEVVYQALAAPLYKILENAGENLGIARQIENSSNSSEGYNVQTGEWGNLFAMGVIDPVKVTRLAIINAVSVASTILTTEALVTDLPQSTASPTGQQAVQY